MALSTPRSRLFGAVALLAALALSGCGGDGPAGAADAAPTPDARAPLSCGGDTCGDQQYCEVKCTCCGVPSDQAPSADYTCRQIPAGCSADDLCACPELSGQGACDPAARAIDIPCA